MDVSAEKKLKWVFLILAIVISYGTIGYTIVEGWSLLDSLYMTVITLSTVGFGEVHKLSYTGKIFTISLVVLGVAGAAYTIGVIGQFIIEGELRKFLGRKKMEKQLKEIKGHYIVCGYGRVGRKVCETFLSRKVPLVVIEKNPECEKDLTQKGIMSVIGDATDDSVLIASGIERAKALISTVVSESENVFITLSARQLNPQIFITARAESPSAEKKLLRAGANKVVSPHEIGGQRMALVTLRPDIVDFMKIVGEDEKTGFGIQEMEISSSSPYANSLLKDSSIRCDLGILIVGIKKKGEMIFNPSPETKIEAGDILIVMGENKQLEKMESSS